MPFSRGVLANIKRKMNTGVLPREAHGKILACSGQNRDCDGCGTSILSSELEYRFEGPDGRICRFHAGCLGFWEAERRRRGWVKPATDAPAAEVNVTRPAV